MKTTLLALFILIISEICQAQAITPKMSSEQLKKAQSKISATLGRYPSMFDEFRSESERKVQLQRVVITPSQNRIHLYCNEPLGQISIRENIILQWEQMVRDLLGKEYADCRIQLYSKNVPIERFVPNYHRSRINRDQSRQGTASNKAPLTQNTDRPIFGKGLSYKHIAIWASHGKCYDREKREWIYQRPALFGSIEDLNTFEYTYRYLIPMLENAGAVVISPRERDPNSTELIVDEKEAKIVDGDWRTIDGGFGKSDILKNENPFELGQHLATTTGGMVEYPLKATVAPYALYVSYKANRNASSNVEYEVIHTGGKTKYRVNQQIGVGWVYLGTHTFDKNSSVRIKTQGIATTDAIRIGGGMGNVERGGKISGVARWAEGARYSLQYNGVPRDIYAQDSDTPNKKGIKEDKDYYDDYKSRGDWATWIKNEKGVPLDAVVAFHTNAGIVDTIFGSLAINYTKNKSEKYTNGQSKWAGRDLADLVLTQVVSDIRAKYRVGWTQRSLYDKQYAEISRPDAPAIILELLSHQNMNDMIIGLNPQFRFDACRAVYKGILRFLSDRYGTAYVVQPLAPHSPTMQRQGDKLHLSWKSTEDSLEKSATPTYYKVYTRIGNSANGFDNGVIVRDTKLEMPITQDGKVRSYKVTALNDGGESFACEILSACFLPKSKKMAMIVNKHTRLSPPDTVKGGLDFGKSFLPYRHDLGIVGKQINFDRNSKFIDNENPGWGASTMEIATKGIEGNRMDYTVEKGVTLISEGYSYMSTSKDGYDTKRSYDKVVTITER